MKVAIAFVSAVLIQVSLLVACGPQSPSVVATPQEPLVVFLVRHAEKVDSSTDPQLSAEGQLRALVLAATLHSAEIQTIHSSDFIRTRDTAAPLAALLGKTVQLYDPGNLVGFSADLRQTGGRHLVVGHSNTTPALVEMLGGDGSSEIDEATEYDRLYIVTIAADATTSSVLMRFGDPYIPD